MVNYPQTGFYFSLSLEGEDTSFDAAFQEASGLYNEMDMEEVASDDANRFRYRLPNVSTMQNLVLKKGTLMPASPLIEWFEQSLKGVNNVIETKNATLNLLNQGGIPTISWTFNGAYPVKIFRADLVAQENQILVESMELAYQYFTIKKTL